MPYSDPETKRVKQRTYARTYYQKNRKKHIGWVKAAKQEKRDWFTDFKSKLSCMVCGENEPCCLHFHHRDPKEKDFSISTLASRNWGKQRILAEIAKCDVLCANCHYKVHAGVITAS